MITQVSICAHDESCNRTQYPNFIPQNTQQINYGLRKPKN